MKPQTQGVLVLLAGAVGLRLVITGDHLSYLKASMAIPLLLSGVVLCVLGFTQMLSDDPHDAGHGGDHDGHDHGRGGRLVAWLLLIPIATLLLVAPAPLGSDAVDTSVSRRPSQAPSKFTPLPDTDTPTVALGEYVDRALYDSDESLVDRPVRLIGFVAPESGGRADFALTRFGLSCCAADAFPVQVGIRTDLPFPGEDEWVEIVAVLDPDSVDRDAGADTVAAVAVAESITPIPPPANPYL